MPQVNAIEACDAIGLVAGDGDSVRGVRILRRQAGRAEEVVSADLVVDASGRGSRAPVWLEALGYPRPIEESLGINLADTSRFFRRDRAQLGGDLFAMDFPAPPSHRAGLIAAQEDDRWHVTLIGYLGEHAPSTEDGFLTYAQTLRTTDLYDAIAGAEPLGEPAYTGSPRASADDMNSFAASHAGSS